MSETPIGGNQQGPTNETESVSDIIPLGPGALAVHLGSSSRLSLPHDPDLQDSETPAQGTTFPSRDVKKRYRWRLYAIVEYEGFQISSEATYVRVPGSVSWALFERPLKFDVSTSPSSEMTVSMFARDRNFDKSMSSGGYETQVIPLGLVKVNPFLIRRNGPGSHNGEYRIDVQNGTGTLTISTSYSKEEIPTLETKDMWTVCNEGGVHDHGLVYVENLDFVYVEKKDTGRSYGMQAVDSCICSHIADPGADVGINTLPSPNLRSGIQHPFIAPPKFAFKSVKGGVNLLSPLASGGYLFDQLQKERRFGLDKTSFYAAQLVCVLEYLHSKHITLASLRPENILLDSSGNISLCKPGIFGFESLQNTRDGDGHRTIPGTPEYPAPEILIHDCKPSPPVDWWNLGILLYEMLIGIPPFYSKNDNERRHRIIGQELHLPESLPSTVKDILTRLLDKDPTKRLGANGAAEVKSHLFFHNLKWTECFQRKSLTPFKPHDATTVFVQKSAGDLYKETDWTAMLSMFNYPADWPQQIRESRAAEKEALLSRGEDDRWDLVWDVTVQEFHFKNRFTGEKAPAKPEETIYQRKPPPPPPTEHPSERQKEDALGAALEAKYSKRVILQILEYSPNLDANVLYFEYTPTNSQLLTDQTYASPVTPLEWAVEHERLDLVNLFLDHGANVDSTHSPRDGPALLKAVRKRNTVLVEILVQKTIDRVSRTRALALAVEQEDTAAATILLTDGVYCDFEESDRPFPEDPLAYRRWDSQDLTLLRAEDLTPPLIRAARLGNAALVRLLLAHGADANISYHELGGRGRPLPVYGFERTDILIPANFSCGRAVQIAMEMGHSEVVDLLLDAGADIHLEHSAWPIPAWPVPGHTCQPVPRAVYVEVTAGLEAAAAGRKVSKE
ncbi:hypothetical protein N7457_008434 [Penicillium paradoxum]|uniref:uncharacterized protein n=1 Tax=Penicillium paradoxum TaxID=176176 RepID=UPI0025483263|nr:uncharacterized protein N7457_008434 [Penicillium paradoxum]KAJ5773538.1 hypothetical protein N7457_008434 [Penicillium paradoxum]